MVPTMTTRVVACEATVTSPSPDPAFTKATGLGANERCGERCEVTAPPGAVVLVHCPLGHQFYLVVEA